MIAVVPWSAAVLGPGLILYLRFNAWVRPTLRELQRLDSLSRSPLTASFTESIRGAALLRAFGAVPRTLRATDSLLEANAQASLCFQDSSRAMALVLDVGGACLMCAVALFGVAARDRLPAALVGLAVNWAQNFTISLNFHLVNSTASEAAGVAVERLLSYAALPPEAPLLLSSSIMPASTTAAGTRAEIAAILDNDASGGAAWPAHGAVEFSNVRVRYSPELPAALDGLSFSVPRGSFVAVVGRSGSGKSTLAAALFRIVETGEGSIKVDGDDIKTMGLAQVRGAHAVIIPQEPSVFRGTLRANLNPRERDGSEAKIDDDRLWAALASVGLDSLFPAGADVSAALSAAVVPTTLSVGQRQLLCLARALLRQPSLLVLDEATASVDPATDSAIMSHVDRLRATAGSTIICIAHRLDAAMRADFVLVVDGGRAAEFGPPSQLLQNGDGYFSGLVKAAGAAREGDLTGGKEVEK